MARIKIPSGTTVRDFLHLFSGNWKFYENKSEKTLHFASSLIFLFFTSFYKKLGRCIRKTRIVYPVYPVLDVYAPSKRLYIETSEGEKKKHFSKVVTTVILVTFFSLVTNRLFEFFSFEVGENGAE